MVHYVRCLAVLVLICVVQSCLAEKEFRYLKYNFKLSKKMFKLASQIWDGINYFIKKTSDVPVSVGPNYKPADNSLQRDVTNGLRLLSSKNDNLQRYMKSTQSILVNNIVEQVPDMIQLNQRLSKIFISKVHIDEKYEKFLAYYQHPEKYDKNIITRFANTALNDIDGVKNLLEDMHTLLVQGDSSSSSTVQLLSKNIELFLQYSKIVTTPQQFFYDILKAILYSETKGYLVMKYSHKILEILDKLDNDADIESIESDFNKRIDATVSIFKAAMDGASRELLRYNPSEHKEGVTYTELKHVFQEFITNEYDINPKDACKNTCSNYRVPEGKALDSCYYENEICSIRRCDGFLHDCRKNVDTTMRICFSRTDSDRKYEFVDFNNGAGHYGYETGKCWADPIKTLANHLSFPYSCDSCMCVCADTSDKSQRFFNLNPSMSKISENYVVTGARFVKTDKVVHIQIQEGRLLPNGEIDESTTRWAPIKENPSNYHTLVWEEGREVNLDDLHAPKNSVVTGLAFASVTTKDYQKRLHLKIFSTPISYETGRLLIEYDQIESVNTPAEDEISVKNVDIPTRTSVVLAEKSKPRSFVKFGPTGLEQDVGQSTIPFIDLQEVVSGSQVPISGAGIYLKKRNNNGGFLALKLFSYNHVQNLESES